MNNTRYPPICRENNITGTVYVTFTVSKIGAVSQVKLVPGSEGRVDENLEKEALRVIHKLPDFRSGRTEGKPIRFSYTIPIVF